ncbi:hypothetical protein LR68_00699 [Anoxybacillus sp. BCO1]|nr:hypothetical protein LR68_00699 [Anoxybacillus sp. BCO1]
MDTHYDMQQDSLQDIERQLNNIEQQIEKKKTYMFVPAI